MGSGELSSISRLRQRPLLRDLTGTRPSGRRPHFLRTEMPPRRQLRAPDHLAMPHSAYKNVGGPNHLLRASASPDRSSSPTQATCPSGRINTAVGAVTAPSAGRSHMPVQASGRASGVNEDTLIGSGGDRRTAVLETIPGGGVSPQTDAAPPVSQIVPAFTAEATMAGLRSTRLNRPSDPWRHHVALSATRSRGG
jgi:hypothetical protein